MSGDIPKHQQQTPPPSQCPDVASRSSSFDLEFVSARAKPVKKKRVSRKSLDAAETIEAKEGIENYRQKASARLTTVYLIEVMPR